jgi:hypothetical protein
MRTQKAQIRLELPAFQEEKRINKPAVMSEASDLDNGSTAPDLQHLPAGSGAELNATYPSLSHLTRRIANALGITERSAYAIVTDLTTAGYVIKHKDGRRNRYQIQAHRPLAEPASQASAIGDVLAVLLGGITPGQANPRPRPQPPLLVWRRVRYARPRRTLSHCSHYRRAREAV